MFSNNKHVSWTHIYLWDSQECHSIFICIVMSSVYPVISVYYTAGTLVCVVANVFSVLNHRLGSAKPKQPPFYMRHLCQSSYKLQTVFHCVLLVHKVSTAVQSQTRRGGQGMTGLVLNTGRKPSLAGRFQETGSKPQIWLMSFPVWNCASLNASVLDPREKQSFVWHFIFQFLTHSVVWVKSEVAHISAEW